MQQITNIKQLETAINKNGEMVISKDDNNIIIMNMEEYNKKLLEKDIRKHLLKAEDDIRNGRVKEARNIFNTWKEKYGIQYKTNR
jgi:translation elongation factor P/translation initiation factor 5A